MSSSAAHDRGRPHPAQNNVARFAGLVLSRSKQRLLINRCGRRTNLHLYSPSPPRLAPLRPADAAEPAKAWSGTWNNRKYNTNGQLICTVIGEQNGQWIAKFTGTALGKPISYTALMTPKKNGDQTALSGTTKVDGFDYQWSAVVAGKALNGSYKASNGNNGEFKLQSK